MLRLTILLILGLALGGFYYTRSALPDVTLLNEQYPVVHYQPGEDGERDSFEISFQKKRPVRWVKLSQVSRVAIGAIVVSEDSTFYRHQGYDPDQIRDAIKESWEAGAPVRGASTITQQVARNVFLSQERTLTRKARELWVAIELEKKVGKRRILETYLNIAEMGRGIFGVQQAAQHYFNKSAEQLTAKEGAFLAMLLPSPKRYSQSFRKRQLTAYAQRTIEDILFKMQQARYIDEVQRTQELASPLSFETPAVPPSAVSGGTDA